MYRTSIKFLFGFLLCVAFVFPSIVFARIPNDPNAQQWAYKDIGAYQAWDTTTGSRNVIVAIIDDGFDTYHPDLFGNVWRNTKEIPGNGIDDDHNGYIDDVYGWNFVPSDTNGDGKIDGNEINGNNDPRPSLLGLTKKEKKEGLESHGTVIAGIIGEVGNNGLDGAGINWHVKLMNIKVINNTGVGTLNDLPRAIHYAVDNGANIINLSIVGSKDLNVEKAIKYAYDHGVVVIAAAGNDGINLNKTSMDPVCADAGQIKQWVLGVSAITQKHHIAQFSNYGSSCIDIAAPGENISSTVRFSPINNLSTQYSGGWSGTSFAAPMVSGAAALLKGIHPNWGPDQIYTALLSTTHVTPGQDMAVYKDLFGHGLLQIDKAVAYTGVQTSNIVSSSVNIQYSINKKHLWQIDTKNGNVVQTNNGVSSTPVFIPYLIGVDAVATAKDSNNQQWFVTVRHLGGVIGEVNVYNSQWQQVAHWGIPYTGSFHLALGSFLSTGQMEVAITSDHSRSLVSLFNMHGLLLRRIGSTTTSYNHIALSSNSTSGLAIGYSTDAGVFLTHVRNATTTQRIKLHLLSDIFDMTFISPAGGSTPRLLVSGATHGNQFVVYYTENGGFIRLFAPFGFSEYTQIRIAPIKTSVGSGFAAVPMNGWFGPRIFSIEGMQTRSMSQVSHTTSTKNILLLSF